MRWNSRSRCTLACFGFIILFSIFSFRLVYVQMIQHELSGNRGGKARPPRCRIFADRGAILDTNGEVLANKVPTRTVVANGTRITRSRRHHCSR